MQPWESEFLDSQRVWAEYALKRQVHPDTLHFAIRHPKLLCRHQVSKVVSLFQPASRSSM